MRLARRSAAADDLAEIVKRHIRSDGSRLQLGHVEQVGDEAVEPLGFVDDRPQQVGLLGGAELFRQIAQRSRCSKHSRKRRLQVVGDRGEERRPQALGFGNALDAVHILDQPDPLDGQRALIAQRVEQPALIGA